MKIAWIITQIIKPRWTHTILNMQSCQTVKKFALHRFHISVLTLRDSATETGNPIYNTTHALLIPSQWAKIEQRRDRGMTDDYSCTLKASGFIHMWLLIDFSILWLVGSEQVAQNVIPVVGNK